MLCTDNMNTHIAIEVIRFLLWDMHPGVGRFIKSRDNSMQAGKDAHQCPLAPIFERPSRLLSTAGRQQGHA